MKAVRLLLTIVLSLSLLSLGAMKQRKADKDTENYRYDIEYAKTGSNGNIVVKVWSYSKRTRIGIEQCKKNAVHGVLFKGYASAGGGTAQKALVKDPTAEVKNAEFFDAFFSDGGPYMKYVSAAANSTVDVVKVGKEYKSGVVVTVSKDQLRSDLESAGIIKGLASGF